MVQAVPGMGYNERNGRGLIMKLKLESDRAIIQFEEDDSRILTHYKSRCVEIDISLDAFEDLCLQYTAIIKSVLGDIKNG